MNRREFLRTSMLTAVALTLPEASTACTPSLPDWTKLDEVGKRDYAIQLLREVAQYNYGDTQLLSKMSFDKNALFNNPEYEALIDLAREYPQGLVSCLGYGPGKFNFQRVLEGIDSTTELNNVKTCITMAIRESAEANSPVHLVIFSGRDEPIVNYGKYNAGIITRMSSHVIRQEQMVAALARIPKLDAEILVTDPNSSSKNILNPMWSDWLTQCRIDWPSTPVEVAPTPEMERVAREIDQVMVDPYHEYYETYLTYQYGKGYKVLIAPKMEELNKLNCPEYYSPCRDWCIETERGYAALRSQIRAMRNLRDKQNLPVVTPEVIRRVTEDVEWSWDRPITTPPQWNVKENARHQVDVKLSRIPTSYVVGSAYGDETMEVNVDLDMEEPNQTYAK